MSKVTNLRTARKQRARQDKREDTGAAAARSAELAATRRQRDAEDARRARQLDGHRRETPEE